MRRAHDTALVVTTDDESRLPIAIITDTDIAQAVADREDVTEAHIDELAGPAADGRPFSVPAGKSRP